MVVRMQACRRPLVRAIRPSRADHGVTFGVCNGLRIENFEKKTTVAEVVLRPDVAKIRKKITEKMLNKVQKNLQMQPRDAFSMKNLSKNL